MSNVDSRQLYVRVCWCIVGAVRPDGKDRLVLPEDKAEFFNPQGHSFSLGQGKQKISLDFH